MCISTANRGLCPAKALQEQSRILQIPGHHTCRERPSGRLYRLQGPDEGIKMAEQLQYLPCAFSWLFTALFAAPPCSFSIFSPMASASGLAIIPVWFSGPTPGWRGTFPRDWTIFTLFWAGFGPFMGSFHCPHFARAHSARNHYYPGHGGHRSGSLLHSRHFRLLFALCAAQRHS